jgi:hypothetical protein
LAPVAFRVDLQQIVAGLGVEPIELSIIEDDELFVWTPSDTKSLEPRLTKAFPKLTRM